jgi:hypothetical protein
MKKIIALALLAVAVGAAGVRYAGNDEPEYIQSAEIRVGSYLTSDYGVACASKKVNDQRWELDCTHQARGKHSSLRCIPLKKHLMVSRVPFILKPLMTMQNRALSRGLCVICRSIPMQVNKVV